VSDTCTEVGVPSALALSIFTVESKLKTGRKTWEPNIRAYAYNVPQILYSTAYSEGFRGEPDELLEYQCAIYWAVKHIKTLMYVYNGDVCCVIRAYNAGDCVSGNYGYLEKVLTIYRTTYYPDFECGARSVSIVDNAYNTYTASHIFYKVEAVK
jgi:soluble lytic murein transglycosylase-like protein